MVITSNRVRLRPLKRTDVELLYVHLLNDEKILHYLDVSYCADIETAQAFVEKTVDQISSANCPYFQFWVIESIETIKEIDSVEASTFIGAVWSTEVDVIKRMVELEFFIVKSEQGKGYMTEALRALIEHYYKYTDVFRIEGVCNIENSLSENVMLKAGMQFEGVLRGRALNLNSFGNPGDLKIFSIIKTDKKSYKQVL